MRRRIRIAGARPDCSVTSAACHHTFLEDLVLLHFNTELV